MISPDPTLPGDGLSLVRDDLLFRIQRRLGLIPADGLGLVRRAVFWSLFTWAPIALWAWWAGRAVGATGNEPLLAHFGVHVRFLVAVPLLILAEMANRAHELDWAEETGGASPHLGFGGWWLLYVGRPIYLVLVLGWLWRVVLLALLFARIAGLGLSIVPTHPDRLGGLGFVERIPVAFAPVVLAIGAVLAARWTHDVVYHAADPLSLRVEMAAFVVVVVAIFAAPSLALSGCLRRAKKRALLEYGALVAEHGRLVRDRWIEGKPLADDALLRAPEIGPVADTQAVYDAVKRMRTVPLGKGSIAPLVLAAAAPMIAVLATRVPVKSLLLGILKALI